MEKTCCVTGHRKIAQDSVVRVEEELRREVSEAIADGYTRFLSGFAEGVDLIFAAIIAEEKARHPGLMLEAVIPYQGKQNTRNRKFHRLLQSCDKVNVRYQSYTPACFLQRNRYMVRESQRVIAVYDGRERGGTLFTMRYAHILGKEVQLIKI